MEQIYEMMSMFVLMYQMGSMIVFMYAWIYTENNGCQPPS